MNNTKRQRRGEEEKSRKKFGEKEMKEQFLKLKI